MGLTGTRLAASSPSVRDLSPGIVVCAAGPGDRAGVASFIARLSPESRYRRFLHALRALPDAQMDAMLHFDPTRAVALLGFDADAPGELVGIAQYAATDLPGQCEVGIVVAEAWRRRGVASFMLDELAQIALFAGLRTATAETLSENVAALGLARRWGASLALVPRNAQLTEIRAPLAVRPSRAPYPSSAPTSGRSGLGCLMRADYREDKD